MPDWTQYNRQRGRPRLVLTLAPETHDVLTALAAARFGDNKSKAAEWAIHLGAAILTEPSTLGATSPAQALERYLASD